MQVPETEFSYEIYLGAKLPMFTFTPYFHIDEFMFK